MARLILVIDDELDKRFRDAVNKHMGMKKGNLSIAATDAINDWITKHESR